ncbi:hypothetical protein OSH11_14635 [Kaistia dalseonensis]|uniref:VCBS repeat-containing protein n=1 Tax=Kaistia dalseonensis TaxID=410840 RepID=A0ABU0H9W0_9HYPH|nr:hypothetical protein [Kaistia dalseonensis]MCX5495947.1 hypothetical protein [Kaistia dalseonensis]MDQ0438550.1 hypothetical protein [Kaistia dalseonensis]
MTLGLNVRVRPLLAALLAVATILMAPPLRAEEDETAAPAYPTTDFSDGATEATITDSGITARVFQEMRPKVNSDFAVPVLQVTIDGGIVLDYAGVASGMDMPAASASIAEIDPTNDTKEVYFSSYSGGAHCCSEVVIGEKTDKGWVAVNVGSFDGDGDYLQDLDNDGVAEIVTVDNAFLYAFDCYACSAAPLVIKTVRNGKLVDLTNEPRFQKNHRDWLKQLEDDADPATRWTSPGFLAGWVAASVRAGEGQKAFDALVQHWNLATDKGEETCLTGGDIDSCPARDRKVLKFPDRLKLFLNQNGYPL